MSSLTSFPRFISIGIYIVLMIIGDPCMQAVANTGAVATLGLLTVNPRWVGCRADDVC